MDVFDSTLVSVETDAGLIGWAEVCPLGPFYLPAYAAGVRAGLKELGPHLIGHNPTSLGPLNNFMDRSPKGTSLRKKRYRHCVLGYSWQK